MLEGFQVLQGHKLYAMHGKPLVLPDSAFNKFGTSIDLVAECSGQLQCQQCPVGTAGADGRLCTGCVAGRYNDVRGQGCKDCQKGKYQSGVGNSTCISCAIGTYKASVASSTPCDLCPSNSSTNFIESIDVNNCTCGGNRDRYYRGDGSFVCRCLPGYGKNEHDSSRCSICPPGKKNIENDQQELICINWALVNTPLPKVNRAANLPV